MGTGVFFILFLMKSLKGKEEKNGKVLNVDNSFKEFCHKVKGNIRYHLNQGGGLGLFVFSMFSPMLKSVCKVFGSNPVERETWIW